MEKNHEARPELINHPGVNMLAVTFIYKLLNATLVTKYPYQPEIRNWR